jgi:hypothetical protein
MSKPNKLRGLVVSEYGSVGKLATFLKWSYSKTYRIVAGIQEPNATDINALADAFPGLSASEIVDVFILPYRSQNANN